MAAFRVKQFTFLGHFRGSGSPRARTRQKLMLACTADVFLMPSGLAAIDPTCLRPHSDRNSRVLRTESRIYRPVAYHAGVPEIRVVFLLRAARDPETGRLLVTSYTHAGLAFEADDFADAMARAIAIVPGFALAAGLAEDGIAIVMNTRRSMTSISLERK